MVRIRLGKEEEVEKEEDEEEKKDCTSECDSSGLVNYKLVNLSTTFPFAC